MPRCLFGSGAFLLRVGDRRREYVTRSGPLVLTMRRQASRHRNAALNAIAARRAENTDRLHNAAVTVAARPSPTPTS